MHVDRGDVYKERTVCITKDIIYKKINRKLQNLQFYDAPFKSKLLTQLIHLLLKRPITMHNEQWGEWK